MDTRCVWFYRKSKMFINTQSFNVHQLDSSYIDLIFSMDIDFYVIGVSITDFDSMMNGI